MSLETRVTKHELYCWLLLRTYATYTRMYLTQYTCTCAEHIYEI